MRWSDLSSTGTVVTSDRKDVANHRYIQVRSVDVHQRPTQLVSRKEIMHTSSIKLHVHKPFLYAGEHPQRPDEAPRCLPLTSGGAIVLPSSIHCIAVKKRWLQTAAVSRT